ncbi:MAG: glycosyltransferase [Lachnospiraceae bacterium]
MDKIAVLIPCYNESKTIEKVVKDFKAALPEATVYVFDNNSSDDTDEIARKAGAIVKYEYQQGKGNVIRRMFREIDAECYIMTDGDDTYPAESAREMADYVLRRHADMVVGDRLSSTYFEENKRPFHNFGNSIVRSSINSLFHTNIKDIMTGYRAFSYQFVKTFPVLSQGFEIETEMSIHAADKNMFVENVIIEYRDRPEGSESKLNTYSDGFKVLRTIASLFRTYKPMAFFGAIALILAALGVGFMIPVLIEFNQTGLVARFPTLIVCGFVILAAMVSFFAGLQLQTITRKNRQDFEMELQHVHYEYEHLEK